MALDPSLFMQGAQLKQQNAARRDATINGFFDKLAATKKAEADEAKRAETDYEGAAYRVIRDSQAGRAPNPKDVELAKAWDVMNTSQNAIDPSTGMPFPKNRSIFDSINQGTPFVEASPDMGVPMDEINRGGRRQPPAMGAASPELMQGLAEADAANVPSEVPNVFGNLANTLPPAANPKQELERYGAELDIAKEGAKASAQEAAKSFQAQKEKKKMDMDTLPILQDMLKLNEGTVDAPYAGGVIGTAVSRVMTPEQATNMDLLKQNRLDLAAPLAKQLGVNPTDKDFQATLDRIFDANASKKSREEQIRNMINKTNRRNGIKSDATDWSEYFKQ